MFEASSCLACLTAGLWRPRWTSPDLKWKWVESILLPQNVRVDVLRSSNDLRTANVSHVNLFCSVFLILQLNKQKNNSLIYTLFRICLKKYYLCTTGETNRTTSTLVPLRTMRGTTMKKNSPSSRLSLHRCCRTFTALLQPVDFKDVWRHEAPRDRPYKDVRIHRVHLWSITAP